MVDQISWPQLIEYLKQVPKFGAENNLSICEALDEILAVEGLEPAHKLHLPSQLTVQDWLKVVFTYWPHSSDSLRYPVPSPDVKYTAAMAFDVCPKWEGEYGENRMGLFNRILEKANEQANMALLKE